MGNDNKAIVFDFGSVLFRTSARQMYEERFARHGRLSQVDFFLTEIFTDQARSDAHLGKMSDTTYALAEKRFRRPGTDLLFFDDKQTNINAVRASGWRAEKFEGVHTVKAALGIA